MNKQVLLAIFAHPDDESFGPGGTLAKHADQGYEVHICTLTDGAAGTADPDCWDCLNGYETLAERRIEELECAVRTLGARLHFLGYRDSGMKGDEANGHPDAFINQPEEQVTEQLTRLIRLLRPSIIITHDDTGGYFHPDHIAVHHAAMRAIKASADQSRFTTQLDQGLDTYDPPLVYGTVIPRRHIRTVVWMTKLTGQDPTRFGRNQDIDLTKIGKPDKLIHARIHVRDYLGTKYQASRCHGSQGGGIGSTNNKMSLTERFMFFLRKRSANWESFQQLRPTPKAGIKSNL
ncbi:MAG: PIG-L family deacetylase [Chloroflexota bacterium]